MPDNPSTRDERCEEIIAIQAAGLATRLENIGMQKINLGLSGGLDSTLALLVACRAYDQLGIDRKNITAITMPGMATSDRTKSNAVKLAEALGVTLRTIPISDGAKELLKAIKHDQKTQDITYENAQARYRTLILFSYGNKNGGLVLGTGDLSEIALGWATFNGDHISHYNVNASIPKTLVRHLVRWVADQTDFAAAKATLEDILDTPISPELADNQSTEDLLGPYDLHDFFLYHFVRWQSDIAKIQWLAEQAFADTYTTEEIAKWLEVFVTRFFANQWKRSVASDGPKVGSVSLSPRGDWRMPSDIQPDTWVE